MYFVNCIVFCFLVLTTKICSRPILFANVRVNKLYSIVIYGNDTYIPGSAPTFQQEQTLYHPALVHKVVQAAAVR